MPRVMNVYHEIDIQKEEIIRTLNCILYTYMTRITTQQIHYIVVLMAVTYMYS